MVDVTDNWQSIPADTHWFVFAETCMDWDAFEVRCALCHSEAERETEPYGDGQVRGVQFTCVADGCRGHGYVHSTRPEPAMSVRGDLEVRIPDPTPWDLKREVPPPVKCPVCGDEGSVPPEAYRDAEGAGYEPADGYEDRFAVLPDQSDQYQPSVLECPDCGETAPKPDFRTEFIDQTDP